MKKMHNELIAKGLMSGRCVGGVRKNMEVKEIDEVREIKEWNAAGRADRLGGGSERRGAGAVD
jgi:hypothetical protein